VLNNPPGAIGWSYQYFPGYIAAVIVYSSVLSGRLTSPPSKTYLNTKYPMFFKFGLIVGDRNRLSARRSGSRLLLELGRRRSHYWHGPFAVSGKKK